MISTFKRTLLFPIPYIFTDWVGQLIVKLWSKDLGKELHGQVTDGFVEILLNGMGLALCLSKGYRKNIKGFEGRYVFRTAKDQVAASATFKGNNLQVYQESTDDWDVRVTFRDTDALSAFLFAKNQDIMNSLLANDVEVDGNLNYVYKFGFMARDLSRRLGFG